MILWDTPDYTRTCGHCELPVSDPTMVNDIAFHKSCLGIMAKEMEREAEWNAMSEEEREARYAAMEKRAAFYGDDL